MKQKFTILTPPISVNQLYTGRRFLTSKGQVIKDSMAWEIKGHYKGQKLLECPLSITIRFYFKDKLKDIDSCLKGLLDCMQGIVFYNDRQIVELHVFKKIDKGHTRTELEIEPL